MADRGELVVSLTRALARIESDGPFALRLCHAFTRWAGADGGAFSLASPGTGRSVLCVTDDLVSLLEDVQDALDEGPSLEALRTADPVAGHTLEEQERRWSVLARSAPARVSSTLLYALPMRPENVLMGVITLHLRQDDALEHPVEDLQFVADVVGAALVGGLPQDTAGQHLLWAERDEVSQATGMVVAQLGISSADALAVLRAHAFAHDASVAAISAKVLSRDLRFTESDEGEA